MIGMEEAIVQDQLVASANPGKVCVNYPRGTQSRLVVLANDYSNPKIGIDASSPPLDNAYSQFVVLSSGHLGHLLDRPGAPGFIIPGQDLKQP